MKQHICWRRLERDTVVGDKILVTYTFSSFDTAEIDKMETWCKEFIKEGLILDGVKAFDVGESRAEGHADE